MNESDNKYDCMPGWYTLIVTHKKKVGGGGIHRVAFFLSALCVSLSKTNSFKMWPVDGICNYLGLKMYVKLARSPFVEC